MILNGSQTRLYWALIDSIWLTHPLYAPHMTRWLTIQACSVVWPDCSVYDAVIVTERLYHEGRIRG